jgi:two-component system, OmpR family, response regulator RegX3
MPAEATVLVVEDEESYVEALSAGLEREGFNVVVARDGEEALTVFFDARPDIVLLDVMLPLRSGIDVCREIRLRSATPVIMVTARDSELDAVVGLEIGADDYVTKPYRLRELVARIRVSLRRAPPSEQHALDYGDARSIAGVTLDSDRHRVTLDGEELQVPLKEFELLDELMSRAGRVCTRESLLQQVWGGSYGDGKTLDVHIKRLRARIEANPRQPTRITTIRGVGYRFERPSEERRDA